MKTYGIAFALLLLSLNGFAQVTVDKEIEKDTVKINLNPTPKKQVRNHYDSRWCMFDLGINTYMFDGGLNLPQSMDVYELNYGRSLHYNLRLFEQRISFDRKRHIGITQGVNFEWQQYHFVNDYTFEPRQSQVTPVLSDKRFSKNRLSVQIISVPVALQFESNADHLNRSFHLSAGVVGGFVYGANQKTKLEDNGDKNKVTDDFNLNKFRLGFIARAGYGPINFYVQYSDTPLFKDNEGPVLNPIQIGVTLIPY